MDIGVFYKHRIESLNRDGTSAGSPQVVEGQHADFSLRLHLARRIAQAGNFGIEQLDGLSVPASLALLRPAASNLKGREDPENLVRDTPGNARYAAEQMIEAAESAPSHAYWKIE